MEAQKMTINEMKKQFVKLYGGSESDIRVSCSLCKVNEHIDYCTGHEVKLKNNKNKAV